MRFIRLIMAAVATAALLIAVLDAPAGSQGPPGPTVDHRCNTETGQFELSITVQSRFDEAAEVQGDYSWLTAGGLTGDGTPVFTPDPVGPNGTSSSLATAPGDAIQFETTVQLVYSDFIDVQEITVELAGDCSTSTTPTTAPDDPPTPTTTRPNVDVRPRFTG